MLVLSRRPDEKILLPTIPLTIQVISSQGGVVRLGIQAPPHVPILREELALHEKAFPVESEPANPWQAIQQRLSYLTLSLTLLRTQLADVNPKVTNTLDSLQADLAMIEKQVQTQTQDAGCRRDVRTAHPRSARGRSLRAS